MEGENGHSKRTRTHGRVFALNLHTKRVIFTAPSTLPLGAFMFAYAKSKRLFIEVFVQTNKNEVVHGIEESEH